MKNVVMLPPGDRFLECYYWDSYWVVRGLLVSRMAPSATLLLENLLDMVRRFGFVPNGSRKYYLNRRWGSRIVVPARGCHSFGHLDGVYNRTAAE